MEIFSAFAILLMVATVSALCWLRGQMKAEFAGKGSFNYKSMPSKQPIHAPLEFVERLS